MALLIGKAFSLFPLTPTLYHQPEPSTICPECPSCVVVCMYVFRDIPNSWADWAPHPHDYNRVFNPVYTISHTIRAKCAPMLYSRGKEAGDRKGETTCCIVILNLSFFQRKSLCIHVVPSNGSGKAGQKRSELLTVLEFAEPNQECTHNTLKSCSFGESEDNSLRTDYSPSSYTREPLIYRASILAGLLFRFINPYPHLAHFQELMHCHDSSIWLRWWLENQICFPDILMTSHRCFIQMFNN